MRVVRADEVAPGQRMYNSGAFYTKWIRVVATSMVGTYLVIRTTDWDTWKHPAEGVAVQEVP